MTKKYFNKMLNKLKILFLLVFLSNIFYTKSFAQSPQDDINQQDWIMRQQQNILEEKKRNLEFDSIKKDHELNKKNQKEAIKNQPMISGEMSKCVAIKAINFSGATKLSNFQKKQIAMPFIANCVEAKTLSKIIKSVNDYYQNAGYVTTQIKVPKQNLQSGIFELQIIEGKIEKIIFGADRRIEKMQKFMAFGDAEGDVLNINDINQGIYQINRLQSNQAVMKIIPGDIIGKSLVKIDNNKKFPAKFTISKDNLGNNFTGIQRTNFSSSIDNLFFLNDNLNLNYSTNLHDKNKVKDTKSFAGGVSIPFKQNNFSYDFSHSEFKGQNQGEHSVSSLTGFSQSSKIALDRVVMNDTKLRIATNVSITNKNSGSYLDKNKMANSERKLSIVNLGFTASSYLNDTTSIYLNPSYARGLKFMNAKKDRANSLNTTPRAQFDAFKLYANFSKKFIFSKINAPLIFTSEMSAQYARQSLFGSEQFSIGGYYSVRGFRESYINGDSGYSFRNKINFNLGSFLAPFDKNRDEKNQNFLDKNLAHLHKFSLEPFYDYGYVKNKYVDQGATGRLAGAGLKAGFNSKYFNSSLTYSFATNHSKLVTTNAKENKMIYFEISTGCC
jgi:hemolysin activation/secretion protein